jgi:transcriptional regulator with XRE-family HTH domain
VPERGNPTVRRRRLAAELRRLRERAGFIGEEVAERLGWSTSKLSRIETAKSGIKPDDLRLLLDLYRVGEAHRSGVLALARESEKAVSVDDAVIASFPAGYAALVYAESEAIRLWDWEPQVVPGLTQTEDYAREVMRGWYTMFNLPPTELEERVAARMIRQHVLTRDQALDLSVVIDESVLRREFGNKSIMRHQLERLAQSSEMSNIEIRVLPLGGDHSIATGSFTYMQFAQEHDVPLHDIVTVEHLASTYYIEEIPDTNQYRVAFEWLRGNSLGAQRSRDLIADTTRELWS